MAKCRSNNGCSFITQRRETSYSKSQGPREQITMNEIEHLLTQYNIDSRNRRLREYYAADNIWRTLRIERDENRHSAFLAWLIEKDAERLSL